VGSGALLFVPLDMYSKQLTRGSTDAASIRLGLAVRELTQLYKTFLLLVYFSCGYIGFYIRDIDSATVLSDVLPSVL